MCDFLKRDGTTCGRPVTDSKKQCLIHFNILNPNFQQESHLRQQAAEGASPLKNPATKKRAIYREDNQERVDSKIIEIDSLSEQIDKLCCLEDKLKTKKQSVDYKLEKKAKSLFYYHLKNDKDFMKDVNIEFEKEYSSDESIIHYKFIHNKTDKIFNDMQHADKSIWIKKVKDNLF